MVENPEVFDIKARVAFVAYGLVLTGFYFIPEGYQHNLIYYVLVLPPLASLTQRYRQELLRDPVIIAAAAYLGYMVSTPLWGEGTWWYCAGDTVVQGLLTFFFVVVTVLMATRFPAQFRTMLRATVVAMAVLGIITLFVWYAERPFPSERLSSVGHLENPVLMGLTYGVFSIIAAEFFLKAVSNRERMLFLVVLLVLCTVVLLTQSRNAIAVTGMGVTALMLYRKQFWPAITMVAMLVLLAYLLGDGAIYRFSLGFIWRPSIWLEQIKHIMGAPVAGFGFCSSELVKMSSGETFHAHNAYLATARDGGAIGLLLLLALVGTALRAAIISLRQAREPLYLVLVLYFIIVVFIDGERLISRPKEPWLYFWLPIALAAARHYQLRQEKLQSGEHSP